MEQRLEYLKDELIFIFFLQHFNKNKRLFIFDEFSSGFSNVLEEFIVTHSINILSSSIIRSDQIFIT